MYTYVEPWGKESDEKVRASERTNECRLAYVFLRASLRRGGGCGKNLRARGSSPEEECSILSF